MYPYPPRDHHDDEPTEIDVRGTRPDRQPPVATVFDEPTSEVPVIRPGGEAAESGDGAGEAGASTDPEPTTVLITSGGPVSELAQPDSATGSSTTATDQPTVDLRTTSEAPEADPDAHQPAGPGSADHPDLEAGTELTGTPGDRTPDDRTPGDEPAGDSAARAAVEAADDPANQDLATDQLDQETETAVQDPDTVEALDPAALSPGSAPPIAAPPQPGAPVSESSEPAPAGSRAPGEVAEESIAIWPEGAADQLREQWLQLQVRFIDDPAAAVDSARELVTEAVRQLADTLLETQAGLDPFRDGEPVDTEAMRLAMRRYREFLDRVLAL